MKLTNKDKEILKSWGHTENDIKQIEEAIRKTVYELNSKEKISCQDAIKLIGRKTFLSGISRSAFHWSASRYTKDGNNFVSFDSSKLFQKTMKTQFDIEWREYDKYYIENTKRILKC